MPRKKTLISGLDEVLEDVAPVVVDDDQPEPEETRSEVPSAQYVIDNDQAQLLLAHGYMRRKDTYESILFAAENFSQRHVNLLAQIAMNMLKPEGTLFLPYNLESPIIATFKAVGGVGWFATYTK